MPDYREYINALRKCAKEYENDRTSTGHVIVSNLCRDTANLLKNLEQEPRKGYWLTHKEYCDKNNLLPSGLGACFWCSKCNCGIDSKIFSRVNYNYCPNCGDAKMKSEE